MYLRQQNGAGGALTQLALITLFALGIIFTIKGIGAPIINATTRASGSVTGVQSHSPWENLALHRPSGSGQQSPHQQQDDEQGVAMQPPVNHHNYPTGVAQTTCATCVQNTRKFGAPQPQVNKYDQYTRDGYHNTQPVANRVSGLAQQVSAVPNQTSTGNPRPSSSQAPRTYARPTVSHIKVVSPSTPSYTPINVTSHRTMGVASGSSTSSSRSIRLPSSRSSTRMIGSRRIFS